MTASAGNPTRHLSSSTQVNWFVGAGCIALFLFPFAAFGVFAAVQTLRRIASGNWQEALFFGLFAVVFGGVGIGGWGLLLWGRRKHQAQELLKARYPAEPWRWREDWAAGQVEDSTRGTAWSSWLFATLWNLVSFPTGFLAARAGVQESKPLAFIGLLFPVIGVFLLVWAVRASIRYRKYGVSRFQLSTNPGVVGHTIAGYVWIPGQLQSSTDFQLTLSCLRRVTSGSGDDRSTGETVLWQEENTARGEASRGVSGMGTRVPVAFRIPADAEPWDTTNPSHGIVWRLQASTSLPGVDYCSTFEVPVFRTASSDRPLTQEEVRSTPAPVTQANYRQPADSKIRVSTNARGTEVVFPAARNPGAALGITIFTAVWLVVIWFLIRFHAPMVFPIVFGGFGLLLVYGTLELWLRVSQVVANQDGVVISGGYISATAVRRISASEIAEVGLSIGMQAGSRPYYDVFLRRKDGKKLTAGHAVRDKREAEWLAATIRSALGLSPS